MSAIRPIKALPGKSSELDLGHIQPAAQWFEGHQHTAGSLANIFVILTFDPARVQGDGYQNPVHELTGLGVSLLYNPHAA